MSPDRLLTAEEVADLLAVPVGWVSEATRDGRLPNVRLGRYRRYDPADVLAWVHEQKAGGRPATFRTRFPAPDGRAANARSAKRLE